MKHFQINKDANNLSEWTQVTPEEMDRVGEFLEKQLSSFEDKTHGKGLNQKEIMDILSSFEGTYAEELLVMSSFFQYIGRLKERQEIQEDVEQRMKELTEKFSSINDGVFQMPEETEKGKILH